MKLSELQWIKDARNIFSGQEQYEVIISTESDLEEEIRIMEEFNNRCFE